MTVLIFMLIPVAGVMAPLEEETPSFLQLLENDLLDEHAFCLSALDVFTC